MLGFKVYLAFVNFSTLKIKYKEDGCKFPSVADGSDGYLIIYKKIVSPDA
jgi:hypothetical protein